jgi:glycosyltransferase involved in cell wall biosynthesis
MLNTTGPQLDQGTVPNLSSSADRTLVSAVIPTRGRPELLACAVRSALRQTWRYLEVIVVLDGPDLATEADLALVADPRVRTVILPEPEGGCAARNAGVRAARGEWIAFLDDDDEWMPDKIARQMREVRESRAWFPVITSRLIAQSPAASRVLPPRIFDGSQPLADYLFCRTGLTDPGGLMQTSTLLASRELLLAVPFRNGLRMHQDLDWIIRVGAYQGVSVLMVPKPLTVWRVEDNRSTVGRSVDWQFSLQWIREMRRMISRRAFSSFVAVQCVWRARSAHAGLVGRLRILRAFLFEGHPQLRSSLDFFAFGIVPGRLRTRLSDWLRAHRDPVENSRGLALAFSRRPAPIPLRKTSN